MKKLFLILILIHGIAYTAGAKENSIELGALYFQQSNHLSTWDSYKRLDRLSVSPGTHSRGLPFALLDLKFRENDQNAFYLKTPKDQLSHYSIAVGMEHVIKGKKGILDLSLFYAPFLETWKNPYETVIPREKTNLYTVGAKLGLNKILDTALDLNMRAVSIDVREDHIGDSYADLKRDGWMYALSAGYTLSPQPYLHIKPEIGVEWGNMNGKSNAYHEYQASLGLMYRIRKCMLMPTLSYSQNRYQALHPIFSTLRKEKGFRAILVTVWAKPFDLEDYFVTALLAYGQADANISFFDHEMKMAGIAIGYNF
ncbi:MAG: DUF2860 family protein [bacterium]